MKNTILFTTLLGLALFTSCSKNTDAPATPPANNTPIVSGAYTINAYSQRTEDKTSLFKDFVFTFATGGILKAEQKGAVTNGTWVYTPSSVGYYGSTPSKASFTINLGTTSPLSRLNRTWNIDSTKTTAANLSLINPEPLDGEVISFAKQ